jgi:uncharacterized caspase-like protein
MSNSDNSGRAQSTDLRIVSDLEISKLAIKRNIHQYAVEQYDELINKIGQAKGFVDAGEGQSAKPQTKNQSAAVQELTFTTLKFEAQQSEKMGEYEIAYKASNLEDKWRSANNILRSSSATIKDRSHGEGYQYSYWLYGEDKIYRQKLKAKP